MDYVANIGCPDVLLNHNGQDEWLFCPISADARDWLETHMAGMTYRDKSVVVNGFPYVVELFDGLTDSGLIVR